MCHQTPMVEVGVAGKRVSLYNKVTADFADDIVLRHLKPSGLWRRLRERVAVAFDRLLAAEPPAPIERHTLHARDQAVCDFLGPQKRIATEACGEIDPLDIDEYLSHDGFAAARKLLADNQPEFIIQSIKDSGLRGRGGAGFPTGNKWAITRKAAGDSKYIICNGDEGDPGAFMDRMILESFPYRVLEGMIIASLAVGAGEGILYIRHEYPLAVQRIKAAIAR